MPFSAYLFVSELFLISFSAKILKKISSGEYAKKGNDLPSIQETPLPLDGVAAAAGSPGQHNSKVSASNEDARFIPRLSEKVSFHE